MASNPWTSSDRATTDRNTPNRAVHPLGPILDRSAPSERAKVRKRAALTAITCGMILGVAAWLRPDERGFGTHTQLGIAACPNAADFPCPTCGMTTAFAYAVRGRLLSAIAAQPAGGLFALGVMLILAASVRGMVTGASLRINWYRVPPSAVAISVVAMVLLAWGYKILIVRYG